MAPGEQAPAGGALLLGAVLRAAGPLPARVMLAGICKNAGKTVALNHLVRAAAGRGLPLALASTGRDGEERDAITDLPKPRIWAPAGSLLATVRGALGAGTATVAVRQELDLATPLGAVVLGQVQAPGSVLLVGPGSGRRLGRVLDALGALARAGAHPDRLCLVDGSFDRVAAAAPGLTGTVVLAAGAAYSPSMRQTVAQAVHVLELFGLEPVPPALEPALGRLEAPVAWLDPAGAAEPLPFPSALAGAEELAQAVAVRAPGGYLALAGAVTDRLIQALVGRPELAARFTLVVQDPTRLLVERRLWRRFRRQGGRARVRFPIRVAAVVANPCSPVGAGYDPAAFVQDLALAAPGLPVLDPGPLSGEW